MSFKVELDISDDRELRNTIKDMIKGEVVSVARGEIKSIIADVTREGYIPKDPSDIDRLLREIIRDEVKKQLTGYTGFGNDTTIRVIAREEIRDLLKQLIKQGNIIP